MKRMIPLKQNRREKIQKTMSIMIQILNQMKKKKILFQIFMKLIKKQRVYLKQAVKMKNRNILTNQVKLVKIRK